MIVQVKLFAVAKQLTGQDSIDVELPEGATLGDLRRTLIGQAPALADVVKNVLFAVNAEYADDQTKISPKAEIACIPPVSGG